MLTRELGRTQGGDVLALLLPLQEPLPSPGQACPVAHGPVRSLAQAAPGPHTCPVAEPLLPPTSYCPSAPAPPPASAPGMDGRVRQCMAEPPGALALRGSLSRPPPSMAGKTFSF